MYIKLLFPLKLNYNFMKEKTFVKKQMKENESYEHYLLAMARKI